MKTIEDQVRELVDPSYRISSPVYQSNDWWVCFKNQYLYATRRKDSNSICYITVYEDCMIIKKESKESRKYTFKKIGEFDFLVPTAKSSQNWICFNGSVVERRSSSKEFEVQQRIPTKSKDHADVAIECVRYVSGTSKLLPADNNEEYKRLILKCALLDDDKNIFPFMYLGER